MERKFAFEFTEDMLATLIDCVNDRLESVEDLIAFEESNGNEVDASTLRDVSLELHELVGILER